MATETSIQDCQKMRRRRRSKMSAVAPPRRPSRSTGSDAAVCIRAIRSGEAVSDVMSHVPAVSCIQVPMDETVEATQRSRKSGMRRGSKPETEGMGETASAAGPVLGDSKGIALISVYGFGTWQGLKAKGSPEAGSSSRDHGLVSMVLQKDMNVQLVAKRVEFHFQVCKLFPRYLCKYNDFSVVSIGHQIAVRWVDSKRKTVG